MGGLAVNYRRPAKWIGLFFYEMIIRFEPELKDKFLLRIRELKASYVFHLIA